MKLLIVESNGLFREAFARRFRDAKGVQLVGEIDHVDPLELPAEVEVLEPDIVLIGVGVADSDTMAAVGRVLAGQRHPGVLLHGRSLTLPAAMKVAEMLRSIDRGFAYLDTDRIESVEGLVSIVEVVAQGKVVIDPQTTQRLLGLINTHTQALSSLTADERTLLTMLARGETDSVVAQTLGIELPMVSAAVMDVATKFGVDGARRDARVTTILRYLVATGELPMDYDTGAVVQSLPRSADRRDPKGPAVEPVRGTVEVEADAWPADEEEARWSGPIPMPGAMDGGETESNQEVDDDRQLELGELDESESSDTLQRESTAQGPADLPFRYGQEAVEEFNRFSQQGKDEDVAVALRILEWASGRGLRVRWGARSSGGSFALVLDAGSLSFWLLTVWAVGTVEVQFAMMMAQPPFNDAEMRRDLANRLNLVQGVRVDDNALAGRPRVPLASLRDHEDWELFSGAMDWAIREIRSFFEPVRQHTRDAAN